MPSGSGRVNMGRAGALAGAGAGAAIGATGLGGGIATAGGIRGLVELNAGGAMGRAAGKGEGLGGRTAGCPAETGAAAGLAPVAAAGDMTVVRVGAAAVTGERPDSGICTTSVSVGTKRGGVLGGGRAISQLSIQDHGG